MSKDLQFSKQYFTSAPSIDFKDSYLKEHNKISIFAISSSRIKGLGEEICGMAVGLQWLFLQAKIKKKHRGREEMEKTGR